MKTVFEFGLQDRDNINPEVESSKMSVRKTKQRKTVQACLETLPGVHVTAGELYEKLKQEGISVGQTTVYRQLESLVDEGIVNKYFVDDNSPACFAYIGGDGRKGPDECFHCKCEKCGRLIHLHCDELSGIASHLFSEHHFKMNPMRTVFYGVCEDCLRAEENPKRKSGD